MAVLSTAITFSLLAAGLYLVLQGQRAKNLGGEVSSATRAFGRINQAYQGG